MYGRVYVCGSGRRGRVRGGRLGGVPNGMVWRSVVRVNVSVVLGGEVEGKVMKVRLSLAQLRRTSFRGCDTRGISPAAASFDSKGSTLARSSTRRMQSDIG